MDKSEIVPYRHVFISVVSQEIEENVNKYSQSGYCSFTITYKKTNLSATKMNSEKPPAGGGAHG